MDGLGSPRRSSSRSFRGLRKDIELLISSAVNRIVMIGPVGRLRVAGIRTVVRFVDVLLDVR